MPKCSISITAIFPAIVRLIYALRASRRGIAPNPVFTNDDIYVFEPDLARLYPDNHHIQPKIRQQLQVLRDRGLLKQPQRGQWQRL